MASRHILSGLAVALALLLPAQGLGQCGWGITESLVQCDSKSGTKEIPSDSCQLFGTKTQGNPAQICIDQPAYCLQVDGTEVKYFTANLGNDPSLHRLL